MLSRVQGVDREGHTGENGTADSANKEIKKGLGKGMV